MCQACPLSFTINQGGSARLENYVSSPTWASPEKCGEDIKKCDGDVN